MIMKNYLPTAVGANFELTPTLSALAPFREHILVLSGLNSLPTRERPGRRARESQHAVPDQRVAADERDLARRRHLDGPDSGQRNRQAHPACVARAVDGIGRNRRRVRYRLCVPLHQHDRLEERRTRRCRRRTTRASCSSGCSATAARTDPKVRLARMRQQRSVLDSVTRGGRASAGRAAGVPIAAKLTEYLVGDSRRRAAHPARRSAGRPAAAARRSSRRHSRRLGRAHEADDRSPGAGVSVRSDARHHVHGRPRAQRHDVSADWRARRASPDFALRGRSRRRSRRSRRSTPIT